MNGEAPTSCDVLDGLENSGNAYEPVYCEVEDIGSNKRLLIKNFDTIKSSSYLKLFLAHTHKASHPGSSDTINVFLWANS